MLNVCHVSFILSLLILNVRIYFVFQTSPYGQLRYRVIGDGDFTQFFDINPTTGSISVQRPLNSQDVALYQVIILYHTSEKHFKKL